MSDKRILLIIGGAVGLAANSLKKSSSRSTTLVFKIIPVAFVGFLMIPIFGGLVGFETVSVDGVLEALEKQASREFLDGAPEASGSTYRTTGVGEPHWLLPATITVVGRPFIWEANSLQVMVQALESSLVLLIIMIKFRTLVGSLKRCIREPYLLFVVVALMLAILALSTLGNFGLLARQRVLIYPFLFFLLIDSRPVIAAQVESVRETATRRLVPARS